MSHTSTIRSIAVALTVSAMGLIATGSTVVATDGDTVDGRFARTGVVTAGSTHEIDIAGRGGVHPDATAVSLNLTITQPDRHGYATVFPCGTARPTASTINYRPGATIANAMVSELGSSGSICVHSSATTHVVVDVDGYFTGNGYQGLGPARLLDTRRGHSTVDGRASGAGLQAAGNVLALQVGGRAGIATGSSAVALTLTVTGPQSHGHVTVFPCDEPRPEASTLNHEAGETIANSLVAKVGDDGRMCIYTHAAAHLVVDVNGVFEARAFRPLRPARLLDSRWNHPTVDGQAAGIGRRAGGSVVAVDVTGRGGTATNAAAVALNVTVTGATDYGHLTVFPCGSTRPAASTINYGPGDTVANAVVAKVGDGGTVCIFTVAATHLVVDVSGFIPGSGSGFRPLVPVRLADSRPAVPAGPDELAVAPSLDRLNALRAAYGLAPVRLDTNMSALALDWSKEMSQTGFRHSTLGYAENIAWNSSSQLTPGDAAARLHELWVGSPPHLAAMLDPSHTRVGIGLHRSGGGWFGTHLFAP